jgi:hypothetical protein
VQHLPLSGADTNVPDWGTRDSSVGIATGYGLNGRDVELRVNKNLESSRPDLFWGTPSLLSNGHRGLFPRGLKPITDLQILPRLRILRTGIPASLGSGVYSAPNRNEYQKQKNNAYRE